MSDPFVTPADIADLLANVNSAAKSFETATGSDVHDARRNLQQQARNLVASLDEPNHEVFPRDFQVNVSVAIEIVKQLDLWRKFEDGKTLSMKEAVESSGADEMVLVRMFRQLVAAGVLAHVPGPAFALTRLGKPYLNPNHCAMNSFVLHDVIPPLLAMTETLPARGYKDPTKETGTPFKWLHGEDLWTWLGSHPERARNMVAGMKSLNTGNVSGDAYPFGEELAKLDIKDDDIAIVDIAGGQGHVMEEVRKRNPHLKGRFIVQDLQSTFDAVSGPPPGVEFMAHNMFEPQPIKKAHVYYSRHIVHDWSDDEYSVVLQHLLPLLKEQPNSKLLLVDLVLPDENVSMRNSAMDFAMFMIGGLERNESQWKALLERNGLRIKKIWRGSEVQACVECEVIPQ